MSMSFEKWLAAVDNICYKNIGLSYEDVPDQTWRDWYEDELTPQEAFDELCENEGIEL
jgi:hypothetical protein